MHSVFPSFQRLDLVALVLGASLWAGAGAVVAQSPTATPTEADSSAPSTSSVVVASQESEEAPAVDKDGPLGFLAAVADTTPIAAALSPVVRDQIAELGYEVVDGREPGSAGCVTASCLTTAIERQDARYGVVGAILQEGTIDFLEVVIFETTSQEVVGRLREEGLGETAFVQRAGEMTTRLFANAGLTKLKTPIVYFGIFDRGTHVDTTVKPLGRRFPVLSLAGATAGGVGVLLFGVGVLFGITANANHAAALAAATQVDAAAAVDQRDINALFANGLLVVGTAVIVAGGAVLGLGLVWGE